jgi:hypothetical protein
MTCFADDYPYKAVGCRKWSPSVRAPWMGRAQYAEGVRNYAIALKNAPGMYFLRRPCFKYFVLCLEVVNMVMAHIVLQKKTFTTPSYLSS